MVEERFREFKLEDATQETQEDVSYLVRAVGNLPPQLQSGTVKTELMLAINRLASDESCLGNGEFLSRLMRLPPMWRNSVMEYIGGGGPYSGSRLKLSVKIVNTGNVGIRYLRGMTSVPLPDPGTGAPTDRQATLKHYRVLEPGETVTLDSDMAINALHSYGFRASHTYLWARQMPSPSDRPLVEVGYRAEWFDTRGTDDSHADSEQWQRAKVDEIVARAERAASQSDALVVLAEAKPWWPKTEAYASLLSRSGGEEPRRRRVVGA